MIIDADKGNQYFSFLLLKLAFIKKNEEIFELEHDVSKKAFRVILKKGGRHFLQLC